MVKSAVKVIVRTRPTSNFASKNVQLDLENKKIEAHIPKDNTQGLINNQQEHWKFNFDEILHNSSQEEVYDVCAREIVQNVMEGYNGTVLAYGQTGAGKTYTMSGGQQSYRFRGIIPRAVSQLFQETQSRPDQAFTIRVSFCEVYNELVYDLLSSVAPPDQTGTIMIQEDSKHGIIVKGLSQVVCNSEEEALNQLFEGETSRTIAEHKLNKSSTRSHCVYTLHLEARSRVESSEKVVFSKLNLVDLAGSERTKKTGSEGLTLMEANYINKSLSYLEQVVIALSEKGRDHVPYRQSKLTYLLKDSIGGNSKTLMVANVWPEPDHMEETISTLRFATRMMSVSNEAVINIELDPAQLVERYKREVRDLKRELAMHDTLANRGRVTYEPYTPEQQYEMQQVAQSYLDGHTEEIEFDSLRQVKELFVQMRNIYKRTVARVGGGDFTRQTEGSVGSKQEHREEEKQEQNQEGVGEVEDSQGFGLGLAPANAKPMDASAIEPRTGFLQEEEVPERYSPQERRPKNTPTPAMDKNQAFMEFRNSLGKELDQSLSTSKNDLKDKKASLKELVSTVNEIKRQIDESKQQVDQIRSNKTEEEVDVIDEEEYSLIKQMKDLKKTYRDRFEKMKALKEETKLITQNIDQLRTRLVSEFEAWYQNKFGSAVQVMNESIKSEEKEADEDLDPDALAFIKARKHVSNLHKAKKTLAAVGKA